MDAAANVYLISRVSRQNRVVDIHPHLYTDKRSARADLTQMQAAGKVQGSLWTVVVYPAPMAHDLIDRVLGSSRGEEE